MNHMDRNMNIFSDNRNNIPIPIIIPVVEKDKDMENENENDKLDYDSNLENFHDQLNPPIPMKPSLERDKYEFPKISTDYDASNKYNEDDEIVSIFMNYKGSRSNSSTDDEYTKPVIAQNVEFYSKLESATSSSDAYIPKDVAESILCNSLQNLNLNTSEKIPEKAEEKIPEKEQEKGQVHSDDKSDAIKSPENILDNYDDIINEDITVSATIDIPDFVESASSTPENINDDSEKINMYNNEQYNTCQQKAKEFEQSDIGSFYKLHFCLKPCLTSKCREATIQKYFAEIKDHVSNTFEEVLAYNQMRLCVLQKNHDGPCCSTPFAEKKMLVKSRVSNKMETSINSCIYQVPGDTSGNSFYKNRASRLYPIVIGSNAKIKIKRQSSDSKVPKICISLKEHTTPFQMATAYIDWVTYAIHIDGMDEHIISPLSEPFLSWKNVLQSQHATFLQNYFKKRNRKIFDVSSGARKTICAVKQNILTVSNFADTTRDNRVDIDQNDIQMGHIVPRNSNEYTIRGTNLLMMTREGNRAVGENDYMDNAWILRDISILQNLCNPKLD
jgi:hypothetical protein